MIGFSTLVVASALMALPAGGEGPPKTTLAELNAMVKAGNYHLIRKLKVGHEIEAVGVVRKVGDSPSGPTPLLTLTDGDDGKLSAVLHNLPKDHGLKDGDRVKFRALILNEAYATLQLWAYTWTKLPPVVVERPVPPKPKPVDPAPKPTTTGPSLAGKWLLTFDSGFEYDATIEPAGEPGLYRLTCGADNLQGVYELKGQTLTLVETTHTFLKGMAWEVKNNNAMVLTTQPNFAQVGSDYRGTTLGRQKQAAPRR